jgi:hypothetical protein
MFSDIRRGDIVKRPGVHTAIGLVRHVHVAPTAAGAMVARTLNIIWANHLGELELIGSMEPAEAKGLVPHATFPDNEYATGITVVDHKPSFLEPKPASAVIRNLRAIELE